MCHETTATIQHCYCLFDFDHDIGELRTLRGKKRVELKLSIFPENVAIGDTCYVLVTAINHSEKIARAPVPVFGSQTQPGRVGYGLSHHGAIWLAGFERFFDPLAGGDGLSLGGFTPIFCPSGKAVTFIARPLQLPPLEELYHNDFWKERRQELQDHQDGLLFDFHIHFNPFLLITEETKRFARAMPTQLTQEVTIKLRSNQEMEIIDQWYRNTHVRELPVVMRKYRYQNRVQIEYDYPYIVHFSASLPKDRDRIREERAKILVERNTPNVAISNDVHSVHGYPPRVLVTTGNRYAYDPSAPATWQEWKKLEDSLTPSTMRDEIRLARILFQYCATEDKIVLQEMKQWFAGMNEIQRIVMAHSIAERITNYKFVAPKLLPLFHNIYGTIQEYDVVLVPENTEKHLKTLGLTE